jgi:monovalent cation:H+ antiporter-2, CPA2 family
MHSGLSIILTLLATAVLVVVGFRKLNLPPLLGYLAAGLLLGSSVLNVVKAGESLQALAEFGVVFLMFSIGLEFSLPKLFAMRRAVFLIGGTQVALALIACVLIAVAVQAWTAHGLPSPTILQGLDWKTGVVLGGALAMSSTAIVVKTLTEHMQLDTAHGRTVLGVLLFQDLAVVLLLVLVPALTQPAHTLLWALGLATLKAAVLLTTLLVFGQNIMQRLFDLIARQHSRELFTITVLLITLGLAWLTELAGLSLALGAFVAGMLIAETPYRHAVEEDIKPFRDVLLGLFFLTLGMQLDLAVLLREPLWVLLCFVLPMLFKAALVYGIVKHSRLGAGSTHTALRSSLALCGAGEFGFVLLNLANQDTAHPLMGAELSQVLLAAMMLSMMAAPLWVQHSESLCAKIIQTLRRVHQALWRNRTGAASIMDDTLWLKHSLQLHQRVVKHNVLKDHAIVLGYGRSGQTVAQLLRDQGQTVVALDLDPDRVREAKAAGHRVDYGDATQHHLLAGLSLTQAKVLVITFANTAVQLKVLHSVHALAPNLAVVVRTLHEAGDANHQALIQASAHTASMDIVPERLEGTLMLASHALLRLGVPMRKMLHTIQNARGSDYQNISPYFHGADDSNASPSSNTPDDIRLHTVLLTESAWAVGQTVQQCREQLSSLLAMGLVVQSIRSSLGDLLTQSDECDIDTAWVLQGSIANVFAAEARLLHKTHA